MNGRKKKLQNAFVLFFSILCIGCFLIPSESIRAAGKNIRASISSDRVKIGKTVQIQSQTKKVSYRSADTSIATVSAEGRVTGKKQGTTIISVRKKGYNDREFSVTVAANGVLPNVPVTLDETDFTITGSESSVQAVVKNNAVSGNIRKIVYEYEAISYHPVKTETISPGAVSDTTVWEKKENTIKLTMKSIAPGKLKKAYVNGDFGDADRLKLNLKSVKLYAGKALLTYSDKGKVTMDWGVADKTAPIISGWTGKDSYYSNDIFMVIYPDKEYDFSKYIKAVDDHDGKIKVQVDERTLNRKKKGIYDVVFTATDKAGNRSRKKAKVQVRTVGRLEKAADDILSDIIKESWSDQKKAEAIYRYIRKNYTYVNSNDSANWENSAYYGLKNRKGNGFVYYSVSKILLTRCGIPNLEVTRSGGNVNGHWWNYVYVNGGWYHFDATPRQIEAMFCLVTDSQLTIYSNVAGHTHVWDKNRIPKGASKEISKVQWGRYY